MRNPVTILTELIQFVLFMSRFQNTVYPCNKALQSHEDELPYGCPPSLEQPCDQLKNQVIIPYLMNHKLGKTGFMDIRKVMPFYKYHQRFEIISIMDQGESVFRQHYKKTAYYKDQVSKIGIMQASLKAFRYYQLFLSIKTEGLKFDFNDPNNLVIMFCAKDIFFRLDGTHRASILRYFQYYDIPVLLITPKDILVNISNIPSEILMFLNTLKEPDINCFLQFIPQITQTEIKKVLKTHSEWYQDIEFGKHLITYTQSHRKFGNIFHFIKNLFSIQRRKNKTVFAALPELTGRKVLDIGCNSGLYSCYASMRGADFVMGIDMDQHRIQQANIVKDIFLKQGRIRKEVVFRQANIQASLDLLNGFDTMFACCMLYHIGDTSLLKKQIKQSRISMILIQCNTARGEMIGDKNRIGVPGYESGVKTWGNILGTLGGAEQFLMDCGFSLERTIDNNSQFPVLIGVRNIIQ